MIKYYCDVCVEEITENNKLPESLSIRTNKCIIEVQVNKPLSTDNDVAWEECIVCTHCFWKAVTKEMRKAGAKGSKAGVKLRHCLHENEKNLTECKNKLHSLNISNKKDLHSILNSTEIKKYEDAIMNYVRSKILFRLEELNCKNVTIEEVADIVRDK